MAQQTEGLLTLADARVQSHSQKGKGIGGSCEETSEAEERAALEASFGKVCGSESAVMFTKWSCSFPCVCRDLVQLHHFPFSPAVCIIVPGSTFSRCFREHLYHDTRYTAGEKKHQYEIIYYFLFSDYSCSMRQPYPEIKRLLSENDNNDLS